MSNARSNKMERKISIGKAERAQPERWISFSDWNQLHRTDPFTFELKFLEILVEWIASIALAICKPRDQKLKTTSRACCQSQVQRLLKKDGENGKFDSHEVNFVVKICQTTGRKFIAN